ncbi:MAG: hypothetical protein IPH88_14355 [Bacteroidales bacterium]|nr:hypothetical protein [Bacteroidales bacterium]
MTDKEQISTQPGKRRDGMKPAGLLLLILPILFLYQGFNFHRTTYSNDPEYAYLLNGLNISRGQFVGHAENPGTTVQWISAAVITAHYWTAGDTKLSMQEDVLRNPDAYIQSIHLVLMCLIAFLMAGTGFVLISATNQAWPGILLQLGIFSSANLLEHAFTKVSPEPVLIMITLIFATMLVFQYSSGEESNKKFAFRMALVSALGLATKATFLPLLFIPLFILPGKQLRIHFLKWMVILFFIITLPAITQYPHMAKWFVQLFVHTGTYGQGAIGVLSPTQYLSDLWRIIMANPVLILSAFSSIAFYLWKRKANSTEVPENFNSGLRLLLAISVSEILAILMVAKHYHANHYLIPVNALVGMNWILISILLQQQNLVPQMLKRIIPYIFIAGLLIASILTIKPLKLADYGYRITNEEYDKVIAPIQDKYPDYTIAWYYPTSINKYSGLRWGNVYARDKQLEMLNKIYPGTYFFDQRYMCFMKWETRIDSRLLNTASNGKILIAGGPLDSQELNKMQKSGISLIPVYIGRAQVIYKVDISNSTIFR